jgi:trk system potassium uptake protein TrkA
LKIVIVGGGEVGFYFAQWLAQEHKDVVVIDKNPNALKYILEHLDVQTLQGSGANPKVLEEAGLKGADILLAVTDSDEVNLTACFFANILAPDIHKVALLRSEDYSDYRAAMARDILNISMVINPEIELVNSIIRLINAPDVEEINDFVGGRIKLVGKHLPEISPLSGRKLLQLPEVIEKNRMIIAALVRKEQLIIPKGKDSLQGGDFVYFVCQTGDLKNILSLFASQAQTVKNLMIVGGGRIGFRLARALDPNKHLHVKIIECNPQRCETISNRLHRIVVLQGFATDQAFLEQENVGDMDMVIAVTDDEEMNILSCLLAKRLGAKKTVARVNKFAYMKLVQVIGIDHIVSPRRSAINSIFPFMRRGQVVSTVFIKGQEAEVLEAVALENSDIVGTPLKNLKFPKEALILCLARGEEVIIPSGDTIIQPQDTVIILSTRQDIGRVEQTLTSRRR